MRPSAFFAAAFAATAGMYAAAFGGGPPGDPPPPDPPTPAGPPPPFEPPPLTESLAMTYAYNGCTDVEIAARCGVDKAEVRRFARMLQSIRARRVFDIRKAQTDLACKPNGPALVWLGRNELNQALSSGAPDETMPELPPEE